MALVELRAAPAWRWSSWRRASASPRFAHEMTPGRITFQPRVVRFMVRIWSNFATGMVQSDAHL